MRVLVCGGRDFEDAKAVNRTLSALHAETPITLLIAGGARGADRLAEKWADRMHIPLMVFPAHWSMGKRAGPVRNGWMLEFGIPDAGRREPGHKQHDPPGDGKRRHGRPLTLPFSECSRSPHAQQATNPLL